MQKVLRPIFVLACLILAIQSARAADLRFDFNWVGRQDKCATESPAFRIISAPEGTTTIDFNMVDLNVPAYHHGGGKAEYTGKDIPRGAFQYNGPCPPSGSHKYEWTAKAYDRNGRELGRAKAMRPFPPR